MLLISGSGPTERDGNSKLLGGANNSLKLPVAGPLVGAIAGFVKAPATRR